VLVLVVDQSATRDNQRKPPRHTHRRGASGHQSHREHVHVDHCGLTRSGGSIDPVWPATGEHLVEQPLLPEEWFVAAMHVGEESREIVAIQNHRSLPGSG